MADLFYGFDNEPFGGTLNFVLDQNRAMPDFGGPVSQVLKENYHRANRGKLWTYRWYAKEEIYLKFVSVGSNTLGSMRGLANLAVSFLWYKDYYNEGGTGTMMLSEDGFTYTPTHPLYVDFAFRMEEVE